jgi:formylglycine-generating enzyme required for sulfatase activity/predicted Ser/Thr protein kinase
MPDTPDPSFDPDSATIPLSGPRPTLSGSNVDLPLPEELAKLLPAGAYEVTDFLGAGGMGAVYKGMQVRLKRPVAIKIMRRDMGKDHDFEARFEREAQAMAKLNHPNIISVIDFGEAGPDYLFIVMELVDGTDLMDVIRSKQMTQEMALTLLPQICDALQFAHDHGIVHRDIKPSNIMLTRDGRVKMADFGLAKHFDHADTGFRTQTGTGMGTPDYAAPEQFDPTTPVDHRADIYALGVMIYQMITGALPRGVWRPPSQRAPVSTQWDAVVSRAMQNDPSERYQKASEVKTELSSIPLGNKSDAGTPARKESTAAGRSARITSKSPLLLGLIGGAAVIAVGAFFALRGGDDGRVAKAPAPPPVASSPAKAATPTPIAAPPLPEPGWQPLFTDAEWRTSGAGHEFKDGVIHLSKGWRKPQPSADGALRARFRFLADSKTPSVVMRMDAAKGTAYVLGLSADGKSAYLNRWGGAKPTELVKRQLPKPAQPGNTVTLELRIQGDHLSGMINGTLVVETQDASHKAPGEWGISAENALFESVEVQPLPAAALTSSAQPTWQKQRYTSAEASLQKARLEQDGALTIDGAFNLPGIQARNIAVRAEMRKAEGQYFSSKLRWSKEGSRQMEFFVNDARLQLQFPGQTNLPTLARLDYVKQPVQPNEWVPVEFAVIGERSFGKVRGVSFPAAASTQILQAGSAGFSGAGSVRNIEVINLDGLPEAEALRLLGVDEQGNDLRGKSAASPTAAPTQNAAGEVWEDLIKAGGWDAPWKIEDGILTRPAKTTAERKWTSTFAKDGALRITRRWDAAWYDLHMMMRLRGPRLVNVQFLEPKDNKIAVRLTVNGATGKSDFTGMTQRSYQRGDLITIELRAVGENLTVTIDGDIVVAGRDEAPIAGSYAIVSEHSDAPAIHKVEFLNLDGKTTGASATASSSALNASKSSSPTAPLEPGAIRLWDAPEKLPGNLKGISWKDEALHIHSSVMAVRVDNKPLTHRDSIVRFALRMNRDAQWANVIVRDAGTPAAPRQCKLSINPPTGVIKFIVADGGTERDLKSWPLPRPYAPEEWLRVELRSAGDDFTVSLDGQPLETVHDATLPNRGLTHFGASANAYFRDIVYVPLDKPADATLSPTPTTTKDTSFSFAGHRYQLVPGNTSWNAARAKAAAMGGHLVAINNSAENDWIRTTFVDPLAEGKMFWIGATNAGGDGQWRWINGDAFTFTGWAADIIAGKRFNEANSCSGFCRNLIQGIGWSLWGPDNDQVARNIGFLVEWDDLGGGKTTDASPAAAATKDAPFINTLGMKFVPVPITGGPTAGQRVLFSIWETRVQDYEVFAKETKREWPKPGFEQGPTHPAVNLSWSDANAWCAWLTERERKAGRIGAGDTYRLPSDHEWSCAVGIGDRENPGTKPRYKNQGFPTIFPWGTTWPPPAGVENLTGEECLGKRISNGTSISGFRDDFMYTAPVGSFAPSREGLFDLAGNVLEFCADFYDADDQPRLVRVTRGGGFTSSGETYTCSSCRQGEPEGQISPDVGFRPVLVISSPAASTSTSTATKDAPFTNTLGMKFVPVPGTKILMCIHETRKGDYRAYADANSAVDATWKNPNEKGVPASFADDHPVCAVNWEEAHAFCAWLSQKEGRAYRLPTDHEWSIAVGIGDQEDSSLTPGSLANNFTGQYLWGTQWPPPRGAGNFADTALVEKLPHMKGIDGYATTAPVMRFTPNNLGIYDLAGNVWEYCEDWFDKLQTIRTYRGGCMNDGGLNPNALRLTARNGEKPGTRHYSRGFRVVLESAPVSALSTSPPLQVSPSPSLPSRQRPRSLSSPIPSA